MSHTLSRNELIEPRPAWIPIGRRRTPNPSPILSLIAGRTPGGALAFTWALFAVIYLLSPISLLDPPGWATWSYFGICLAVFTLASHYGGMRPVNRCPRVSLPPRRLNRIISVFAVIGLIGGFCILTDKIFFSGLDFSRGFTAARYERINDSLRQVYAHSHTLLMPIGLVTFHCSVVALMLFVLQYEKTHRRTAYWVTLGLSSPLIFAVVNGGRSAIGVALVLMFSAFCIRKFDGLSFIPKGKGFRGMLIALLLGAFAYSSYIFDERRRYLVGEGREIATLDHPQHFSVKNWALDLADSDVVDRRTVSDLINTCFYLIHSSMTVELLLNSPVPIGPYYGQYEISVISTGLDATYPRFSLSNQMFNEMNTAGIFGVFAGAWGSFLLDGGWAGLIVVLLLLGWYSGTVYRRALHSPDLGARLMLCFIMTFIWLSPIHSLFGMCHSYLIFVQSLICGYWIRSASTVIR